MAVADRQNFVTSLALRYGSRLRRFLGTRLSNASDVPDLAQEVFLRLLRIESHESIRSPEAYLFTIANHVIHQHAVKRASEPVRVRIDDVFAELRTLTGDDPAAQAERSEQMARLERVLEELPAKVSTALVLHRLVGCSVQEIADQMGVARETAKKYLARAVEHCRNRQMGE